MEVSPQLKIPLQFLSSPHFESRIEIAFTIQTAHKSCSGVFMTRSLLHILPNQSLTHTAFHVGSDNRATAFYKIAKIW